MTYRYADESPFGSAYHTSFHQVNQIVRENNSTAEALTYDANGNVTRLPFRRNMKLYWTSFNKLASAFPNGYTAIFRYNADHQRMYQRNGATGDTWYAGDGLVEHFKRRSDGRETLKYALMAGGQSVGYIKISFDRTASPSGGYQATNQERLTFYQLKDHLGSPQVLVNANGDAVENLGFTAWGERRAASWNPNEIPTPALDLLHDYALTQGFTGHEHDDVFGFINMKGRLYDPKLGRFLSADPFVQFPNNTQSYNRYSYVLNNPLSYTDPSGYLLDFIGDLIGGVVDFISDNIRTIAAIAVQAFLTTLGVPPGLISFGLTLVSGGSLESAIQNGIFATVSAGVSSFIGKASAQAGGLAGAIGRGVARFGETFRSIVHGVAQGTLSVLQGGKFGHGFASAFVSHETAGLGEYLNLGSAGDGNVGLTIGRTVVAATIGGTVSQITGGKFANGAQTAAFVHLFNAEVAEKIRKLFVGNLRASTNGMTEVSHDFIGGRKILIEGAANAAFGHDSFYYRVNYYEYDYGGNIIGHAYSTNVFGQRSTGNDIFVVNTLNFGAGATNYSKEHYAPYKFPNDYQYIQSGFVKWHIQIPPQMLSNENTASYELNVYQILP